MWFVSAVVLAKMTTQGWSAPQWMEQWTQVQVSLQRCGAHINGGEGITSI